MSDLVNKAFSADDLTAPLMRAARALVGKTVEELAAEARLGVATIRRAEASQGALAMTAANREALLAAFNRLGVVFLAQNGGGLGVRLRD